jgi:DNA polymerase
VVRKIVRGSKDASVLILGEAPGVDEMRSGLPFVGSSGRELSKMLREAQIDEEQCFIANVCNERPPDNNFSAWMPETKKEAAAVGATWYKKKWVLPPVLEGLRQLEETLAELPNLQLVIPLGNVPLWAMTDHWGITKWRGSQLKLNSTRQLSLVPTYHPAAVLRTWEWRWIAVQDLKRAKEWLNTGLKVPEYEFLLRPSYSSVLSFLNGLIHELDNRRLPLAVDLETRGRHIACIGLADSSSRALCIPFMTMTGPYWSVEEECRIVWFLYKILTHRNCEVIGQNYLYDRQYIARRWGFRSNLSHDTMVKHHLAFPGVSKGLDFICSIYNHFYSYWKDESKDWDPAIGESQLWEYNCKDAVGTFEANGHLDHTIKTFCLEDQLKFQMDTAEIAFDMMLRGVRVDQDYKMELHYKLCGMLKEQLDLIKLLTGVELEPSSPKQVHSFCYGVLGLPHIYKSDKKKKTSRLTADKEAVEEWLQVCDPLFKPILQAIVDYRSLQVYNSTFALAPLDDDARFRCSINVAGPETFRWSTSEDAFGYGTNMQNIPRVDD